MEILLEPIKQIALFFSFQEELSIKHFIIFFIAIACSGVFSASEIAIFRIQEYQLKNNNGEIKKKYRTLHTLISNKEKTLSTILIGNNVANVFATLYGSHLFIIVIIHLANITQLQSGAFNQELAATIAGVLLIILLLFFGEIIPKNISIHNSFRWAVTLSPVIYISMKMFWGLTIITMKCSSWISQFFKKSDNKVSEEQVLAIVHQAGEEGIFEKNEHDVIKNILNFNDTSALAIMTPRKKVFSISGEEKISQIKEQIVSLRHSRIPIYKDDNKSNIIGIVSQKDILKHLLKKNKKAVKLKSLAQKPTYIYQTTPIQNVFQIFQKNHKQFGVVVDDFGDFEGIITMEDILEEIVGEMIDESDNLKKDPSITPLAKNKWVAKNIVDISTFIRVTGVEITVHEKLPYETLQGLIMYKIGRLPKVGDKITVQGFSFKVKEMSEDQISLIHITKLAKKHNLVS